MYFPKCHLINLLLAKILSLNACADSSKTAKRWKSRGRKSIIIGGSPAEAETKVESKGQTASSKQHTQKGEGL